MKARIIFEYKDEKIQEILKENDITTADELKGYLKYKLNNSGMMAGVKDYFDTTIDVDYDERCPMLSKKCNLSDTKKLIDDLKNEFKIKELKNELFKETQLNNTLLIDNQKMKEQIDELMNQPSASEFEAKIKDLEKKVAEKEALIGGYIETIETRNEAIKERNEAIKERNEAITNLSNERDKYFWEIKDLQKQNNELMDKIELLEDTPVECSTCVVHSKLVGAKEEIKALKEKLETVTKNRTDWIIEHDKLKISYDLFKATARDEYAKLHKENEELKEKYDQVVAFNDNLHEQATKREELIESLKKKNDTLTKHYEAEFDGHKAIVKYYKDKIDDIFYAGKACAYNTAKYCINEVVVKNPMYDEKRKTKYSREEVSDLINETVIAYRNALVARLHEHKEVIDDKLDVLSKSNGVYWDDLYFNYVKKFQEGTL